MNLAGYFGAPKYLSASGVVNNKPGALIGFLCITSSSGTISLFDNATTNSGTNFLPTMSVTAGTYYPIPAAYTNGLYAILGGTCTFFPI